MYMCVRNIDVVSVPCEWSCICVSGISMLSLYLVSGHVYVCQEYRCCLCTLWVVMYMSVRNIDVVSVPCEWSCICVSGISMLSLYLVSGHVYVCQEYRCNLCSLWVVMYMSVRNIDVVSVPCEWSCIYVCQEYQCCLCSLWVVMYICVSGISMLSLFLVSGHVYMCVRNINVVSVPCEWSCIYVCQEYQCCLCSLWVVMYICVSGISMLSMLSLFLVSGHVYMCVRNINVVSVPCEWSCIYVCQEYRCSLCSLSVVMYICVRNIDVVSVPCEWSCICVSGISMLSLFLVSGHVYVC